MHVFFLSFLSSADFCCQIEILKNFLSGLPIEYRSGLEVIKLEYSLKLKIKLNDWLLANKSRHH